MAPQASRIYEPAIREILTAPLVNSLTAHLPLRAFPNIQTVRSPVRLDNPIRTSRGTTHQANYTVVFKHQGGLLPPARRPLDLILLSGPQPPFHIWGKPSSHSLPCKTHGLQGTSLLSWPSGLLQSSQRPNTGSPSPIYLVDRPLINCDESRLLLPHVEGCMSSWTSSALRRRELQHTVRKPVLSGHRRGVQLGRLPMSLRRPANWEG